MMVVAIDGPAASGKSSVAKGLAEQLGFSYINTGAMYRALTWHALRMGADVNSPSQVAAATDAAEISTGFDQGRSYIAIGGFRPYDELHEPAVNRSVSAVSSVPQVRERLVDEIRRLAATCDCVVEGRDIGSVVFPATPYKLYLDASPEVRQRRRNSQGQDDEVSARDRIDSSRLTAPLTIASDAMVIDTTELDLEEVIAASYDALIAKGLPACPHA